MSKKTKKRLGRVVMALSYVVDMDNPDMIQEAKDCLFEDICNAVKYNEIDNFEIIPDKTLKTEDIPDFLLHKDD